MLDWNYNSDKTFIFTLVILTKTLGACKSIKIRARIDRRLDLWGRGIHAGLVGYALVEGRSRYGRSKRRVEEEEDGQTLSFHITLLFGKLWQAFC